MALLIEQVCCCGAIFHRREIAIFCSTECKAIAQRTEHGPMILTMTENGSGSRAIAAALGVSRRTVQRTNRRARDG